MKLRSIGIKGFRSIADLPSLGLGSPTVLAGKNDAGKSAIIHAIMFLLGGYTLSVSDRTYADQIEHSEEGDETPTRVEETWVSGEFDLDTGEKERFGFNKIVVRRIARNESKPVFEQLTEVPADERLRNVDTLTIPQLIKLLGDLGLDSSKATKATLLERLSDAIHESPSTVEWILASPELEKALPEGRWFDATSAVDAEVAIRDALTTNYKAHLASEAFTGRVAEIERDLERLLASDANDIRTHILKKVSDLGKISISPTVSFSSANGLKATNISVTNERGESINLQHSGAGRSRRVALAIWEYNATMLAESGEDVVLLYDEPDTHLDYGHQRELMSLIHQQTRNPKVQVIIASHSMNLIDGTDIGDVVHVKHEEHRTTIEQLADDSQVGAHLGAIAASVGLRNTVLLHERLFVGVEGASEALALPVLFKLATGRHLESCGIALWPCTNNEGARHFATFLHEHGRKVVFLVDEDSQKNSKHVFHPDRLRQAGLDPDTQCHFIGAPNEIEDVFTDSQWAAAADISWPRMDGRPWSPGDFSQHRDGKFSACILEEIRCAASEAPSGKPDMLVGMALSLTSVEDVPLILRSKFSQLVELAL
ncbi:ATP-dependent nuclease [Brachybacterium sp. AOP25-B2-12]|uniref:ATP-dependent nuclease n=1 Tax=Brachybacterium sp. AOP25-B2-12 TaxID=3457710 RepID=UPI004033A842